MGSPAIWCAVFILVQGDPTVRSPADVFKALDEDVASYSAKVDAMTSTIPSSFVEEADAHGQWAKHARARVQAKSPFVGMDTGLAAVRNQLLEDQSRYDALAKTGGFAAPLDVLPSSFLQEDKDATKSVAVTKTPAETFKQRMADLHVIQPESWVEAAGYPTDVVERAAYSDLDASQAMYKQEKDMWRAQHDKAFADIAALKQHLAKQGQDNAKALSVFPPLPPSSFAEVDPSENTSKPIDLATLTSELNEVRDSLQGDGAKERKEALALSEAPSSFAQTGARGTWGAASAPDADYQRMQKVQEKIQSGMEGQGGRAEEQSWVAKMQATAAMMAEEGKKFTNEAKVNGYVDNGPSSLLQEDPAEDKPAEFADDKPVELAPLNPDILAKFAALEAKVANEHAKLVSESPNITASSLLEEEPTKDDADMPPELAAAQKKAEALVQSLREESADFKREAGDKVIDEHRSLLEVASPFDSAEMGAEAKIRETAARLSGEASRLGHGVPGASFLEGHHHHKQSKLALEAKEEYEQAQRELDAKQADTSKLLGADVRRAQDVIREWSDRGREMDADDSSLLQASAAPSKLAEAGARMKDLVAEIDRSNAKFEKEDEDAKFGVKDAAPEESSAHVHHLHASLLQGKPGSSNQAESKLAAEQKRRRAEGTKFQDAATKATFLQEKDKPSSFLEDDYDAGFDDVMELDGPGNAATGGIGEETPVWENPKPSSDIPSIPLYDHIELGTTFGGRSLSQQEDESFTMPETKPSTTSDFDSALPDVQTPIDDFSSSQDPVPSFNDDMNRLDSNWAPGGSTLDHSELEGLGFPSAAPFSDDLSFASDSSFAGDSSFSDNTFGEDTTASPFDPAVSWLERHSDVTEIGNDHADPGGKIDQLRKVP